MAESTFRERLLGLLSNYPEGVTNCLFWRLKALKDGHRIDITRTIHWTGYELKTKEVYNIINRSDVKALIERAGYRIGFVSCRV